MVSGKLTVSLLYIAVGISFAFQHSCPNTMTPKILMIPRTDSLSNQEGRSRYLTTLRNKNGRQFASQQFDDHFGDFDDDDYVNNYFNDEDDDFISGEQWEDVDSSSSEDITAKSIPSSHFFSRKSLNDPTFRDSDSIDVFNRLCRSAGINRPSRIQSLAWPTLLQGKHTIVADQTGSGKTLAYLIPLLQRILQSKAKKGSTPKRQNGAPGLLVLAPTSELADQIHAVCLRLSNDVSFKTMVITATGGYSTNIRDQIRMLQRSSVDVVISTPGRIATILRSKDSGGLDLTSLQAIVLDEVDVLMVDETFGEQLRTVGAAASVAQTQFVFVTATLPDTIVETVEKEFPGVAKIRGPGLHRVALTVKENLVDVSVPSKYNRDADICFDVKAKQLLKALRVNRCRRTLIFCNTVENCRLVENLLNRNDRRSQIFDVAAYHNAMTPEARNRNLARFSKGRRGRTDNQDTRRGRGSSSNRRRDSASVDSVLVCTDRAARGVDFDAAPVDHVILFDFPSDPAEYVRRVGRTARAGRTGTSTVFAYGWQLPIARKIMGSKLESFTVAMDENNDDVDDESQEYTGGVQGRRQKKKTKQMKNEKKNMIKGNIEGGRLWQGRK